MGSNYSEDFKQTMVRKMSGPTPKSATAISEEVGIPQSTLSRWLREYGRFDETDMGAKKRPQKWTADQKFQAVMKYEGMDEEARGRYLREQGLYSVDIEKWREEMSGALEQKTKKKKVDPRDQRIRELERELRRMEKALAEAAALLVLKKKADAIWGDNEDEK